MATIEKAKRVTVCDNCNVESYLTVCLCCKLEYCYECTEKLGHTYKHALHFSGSDDGYYCNDCIKRLSSTKEDELFNAYKSLQDKVKEFRTLSLKVKKETETLEDTIQQLLKRGDTK